MSNFNDRLIHAQKRQTVLILFGLFLILAIAVAVALYIVAGNGTRVRIGPPEADARASITATSGLTFVYERTVYSLKESPIIKVDAPGFQPAQSAIGPDTLGRVHMVELQPLPGRLRATVSPAQTDIVWRLDDTVVGKGPELDIERDAGNYKLIADHPYFEIAETAVSLAHGKTLEAAVTLKPVIGTLSIDSVPQGATVHIGESPPKETPLSIPLGAGTHRIKIEMDGFEPISDVIEVTRAAPAPSRRFNLEPTMARLDITVIPAGGRLLVNGRRVEPGAGIRVDPNQTTRVFYEKEGYKPAMKTLTLGPGERGLVSFSLAPDIGEVRILSAPPATVVLDGKPVGETPLALELPAVPQSIELRREGYRSIQRSFTPSSDEPTLIRESLTTEAEARYRELGDAFKNTADIEMKLFRPDGLLMGAPRSEQGQRANEFLRQTHLSKPFYASLTEVTNAQYAAFSGHMSGNPSVPVTGISWEDAARYANALSAAEGLRAFYRFSSHGYEGFDPGADGYRLLSEAEWEWLARKAGRSEQTIFPWGASVKVPARAGNIADEGARDDVRFYVTNYVDGYKGVAPVRSYPAEPSGLFDLTGNVREWVHDGYVLDPPRPDQVFTDPLGPQRASLHVVKGSSFKSGNRTELRAAWRDGRSAGAKDTGFRLARYLNASD